MPQLPHQAARTLLFAAALMALPHLAAAQAASLPSAHDVMTQAEASATTGHKAILLEFGASWCGNCRLFERFLADPAIHPIMDKYFVMVTLITGERNGDTRHSNTPGGLQFEESVGGRNVGWPFLVMLDAKGTPVVDSYRPDPKAGKANIGYPDTPAEVDWFMQMLHQAAPSLTSREASTIHTWLSTRDRN